MLTAVCSFLPAWVFVVLGDSYDLDTHSWNPDGIRVIHQQDFWYTFGMTVLYVLFQQSVRTRTSGSSLTPHTICSILIPWFTVREVKVDIEVVSFPTEIQRAVSY